MKKGQNKLNNHGFAISGIIYAIFILILVLMVGVLETLQNRRTSLDRLKYSTLNALESGGVMDNMARLEERIQELEDPKNQFLNSHPINSIYTTVDPRENTPEAMTSRYGGEWQVYGAGRVIVSAGTNGGYTFTAESEGTTVGATTNPLGEYNHTLSVNEMPSHTHVLVRQQWYSADTVVNSNSGSIYSWKSTTGGTTSASYKWSGNDIQNTGGGASHNNIQPYKVAYVYKRIR